MLLLSSSSISSVLLNQANQARASGLMTYNFAGQDFAQLARWPQLRIIMGISPEDERSIRSASRIRGFASINPRARVRLLPRSHVKLAVFWTASRLGYHRAILSTMNGVSPSGFKEIGILLSPKESRQLVEFFETQWNLSTPVNPLDIKDVVSTLSSSVFEVKERP